MSSFILDFLNGKIEPQDRTYQNYSEKEMILTELDENETYLKENLTGEAKEHLLVYIDAWGKELEAVDEAAFVEGFRLGARCMMDILKK